MSRLWKFAFWPITTASFSLSDGITLFCEIESAGMKSIIIAKLLIVTGIDFIFFFHHFYIYFQQARPVDLTRTVPPTTPNTDKNSCRKLAFSVENILDPNKFCSRKDNQNNNARLWLNGGYDRDDRNHMDDDQSESQSGKANHSFNFSTPRNVLLKHFSSWILGLSLSINIEYWIVHNDILLKQK